MKIANVGGRKYAPLMKMGNERGGMVWLSRRSVELLRAWEGGGVSLADAAKECGMSVADAKQLLSRRSVQRYLRARAEEARVRTEWSRPEKWYAEGDRVWGGKEKFSPEQMLVWKEFGERSVPKRREGGEVNTVVEIKVDPGVIEKAIQRRQAIEAELSDEFQTARS